VFLSARPMARGLQKRGKQSIVFGAMNALDLFSHPEAGGLFFGGRPLGSSSNQRDPRSGQSVMPATIAGPWHALTKATTNNQAGHRGIPRACGECDGAGCIRGINN
jgi:hypothetical protein